MSIMVESRAALIRRATALGALVLLAGCAATTGGGMSGAPLRLAGRAADAGDFQTAAVLYRQEFEADPRSIDAMVGLGRSYAGLGQFARAEIALREAARRRPNDPQIELELARIQLGGGKAEVALAHLDRALARAPRDVAILTARGIALDRLSRHLEAQETYRRGLVLDPTNFALLSNLGLSLGLSGQTGDGIVILRELVRDVEATARTRGNLALVYGLAGREREAAATLATELPPQEIKGNLAYYRELRALLLQGRPIGELRE